VVAVAGAALALEDKQARGVGNDRCCASRMRAEATALAPRTHLLEVGHVVGVEGGGLLEQGQGVVDVACGMFCARAVRVAATHTAGVRGASASRPKQSSPGSTSLPPTLGCTHPAGV